METIFSPCRRYRYTLWRSWGGMFSANGYAMFIGLNPSTADETLDDPTIRRCVGFAKAWGYDGLCMTNLFAFRATLPKVMMNDPAPIGPDNDEHLLRCAAQAGVVVAAWGTDGSFLDRDEEVIDLLGDTLHYLKLTKHLYPQHPLYLKADLVPQKWERQTA